MRSTAAVVAIRQCFAAMTLMICLIGVRRRIQGPQRELNDSQAIDHETQVRAIRGSKATQTGYNRDISNCPLKATDKGLVDT